MPGVQRKSIDLLVEAAKEAADLGIPAMAVFPVIDPELKDEDGSLAADRQSDLSSGPGTEDSRPRGRCDL